LAWSAESSINLFLKKRKKLHEVMSGPFFDGRAILKPKMVVPYLKHEIDGRAILKPKMVVPYLKHEFFP
jgi:hypothetical protein